MDGGSVGVEVHRSRIKQARRRGRPAACRQEPLGSPTERVLALFPPLKPRIAFALAATPGPLRGGAMKTRTHFAFRIDVWDDAGNSIFEHVVGSEDFEVAVAAYFAACRRWPKAKITLRQGARVVKKSWRE